MMNFAYVGRSSELLRAFPNLTTLTSTPTTKLVDKYIYVGHI